MVSINLNKYLGSIPNIIPNTSQVVLMDWTHLLFDFTLQIYENSGLRPLKSEEKNDVHT